MVGPHVQRREGTNGNNNCHWRCHSSEVLPWFSPHCTSLSKNYFFVVTPFIIIAINKNSGWRCFHRCWATSNKTGMGIPAKSTRQGQMPPPDQRSLPPIFINLFESGEIHQHGNISRRFRRTRKFSLLEREKSNPVSFQFFSIKIKRSRQQIYRVD